MSQITAAVGAIRSQAAFRGGTATAEGRGLLARAQRAEEFGAALIEYAEASEKYERFTMPPLEYGAAFLQAASARLGAIQTKLDNAAKRVCELSVEFS